MTNFTIKTFDTVVDEIATAVQGKSTVPMDFSIGSIARSIAEADSEIAMWLQGEILKVLALTRAATSQGADLDTWMAQFFFSRNQAVAATGAATFSRRSSSVRAVVPVGQVVSTLDRIDFVVTLDTTNANYSAVDGGYVLAIGTASINCPIAAVVAGTGGNVGAGTITKLKTTIGGVNTVTNGITFTNGKAAETDEAFRARFTEWLASLSRSTLAAVSYAIKQAGATSFKIVENFNLDGSWHPGWFYVIVDDGTGAPSGAFLNTVANAVEEYRAWTVTYAIFGVTPLNCNTSINVLLRKPGNVALTTAEQATTLAKIQLAIKNYVDGRGMNGLTLTSLYQVAYDASSYVVNASSALINGAAADYVGAPPLALHSGTVTVTAL